jgi:hypothetical protein
MADLDHSQCRFCVINRVDHSEDALAHAVLIVARQLLRSGGARVGGQAGDAIRDSPQVPALQGARLCSQPAQMRSLQSAASPQVLHDGAETKVRLVAARVDRRQIFGVFEEAPSDRGIDKVRQALVGFSRLHAKRAMEVGIEVDGRSACVAHDSSINEVMPRRQDVILLREGHPARPDDRTTVSPSQRQGPPEADSETAYACRGSEDPRHITGPASHAKASALAARTCDPPSAVRPVLALDVRRGPHGGAG